MRHRKAFAYMRINNQSQIASCDSLNRQREAISKYAKDNYITVSSWFIDVAKSGSSIERDGLKSLLTTVLSDPGTIDCVIVHSLSRISRNRDDYVANIRKTLETHNIELRSATNQLQESPTDKFMAVLQPYIELSKRENKNNKENMIRRAKKGYSVHRPPLGYSSSVIKGLYQTNDLGHALSDYFKKTLSGEMTTSELRSAISLLRYPKSENQQPKQISSQGFRNIVSNPYYSGYVKSSGQQFKGLHTPLLSVKEQNKLKELCSL